MSLEPLRRLCLWHLIYTTGQDLGYLKRKADGEGFESHVFLETRFRETTPQLSPDGRFIAYCSNRSGDYEVYVCSFPSGGERTQVSSGGGGQPRWSRDGKELFYIAKDTLMAVEVESSPTFTLVSTTALFSNPNLDVGQGHIPYDVAADGRFVMMESVDSGEGAPPTIHVVENWYEEFKDREQN